MADSDERYQRALNNEFHSEFLEFEGQEANKGIDVRDQFGKRLHYWSAGDNIYTVTFKKIKTRLHWFFNPDTYDKQSKKHIQRQAQLYNIQIILGLIFIIAPLSIAITVIQPRVARAKREFLMHQYDKIKQIYKLTKTLA
ncbi:unnamed protein product (macronuclear) [Paramecium tetraurelia]|uniref:WW domain-containing protein n=1 Tax=Paramecium tetraurelia TaxID=5888 RepID=A0CMX8_PARTE|nr:uncharacterized protein GSPATT00008586001 [Paramecium tetraurelia]CAK72145.1 unnamed protein product [Paramecium tetraurelia]|eukprot:XP_001439542.1 hypothetical protein (macronuclear) [Paramecium tetraurelia strain d4-2]